MKLFVRKSKQSWSNIAFPVIRKVFPKIVAKEFVSVQPMSAPSGLVFYLDYTFSEIVIIWDQELWWEENDKGEWVCPETLNDHKISDFSWKEAVEKRLVIPAWEVERDYGRYEELTSNGKRKVLLLSDGNDFVNTSQVATMTPWEKSVYNSDYLKSNGIE